VRPQTFDFVSFSGSSDEARSKPGNDSTLTKRILNQKIAFIAIVVFKIR
jgi:hypothetical protein